MGGKSTFLRQTALIAVLAQAGSFVPAARAKVGIVDRLFSRVGASDNLARGRSTFMVEMVETAAILAQATPKSLVILDEIGRGTSTYDGLAIAWAVVEAMHDQAKCRTLFATHYHELTRLAGTARLRCRCTTSARASGRAISSFCMKSRAARPTAATASRSPSWRACRPRSWPAREVGAREARGGPRCDRRHCGGARRPAVVRGHCRSRSTRPIRCVAALDEIEPDSSHPREALEQLYRLKRIGGRARAMSFPEIDNQRAIIDRRAVADRLASLRPARS